MRGRGHHRVRLQATVPAGGVFRWGAPSWGIALALAFGITVASGCEATTDDARNLDGPALAVADAAKEGGTEIGALVDVSADASADASAGGSVDAGRVAVDAGGGSEGGASLPDGVGVADVTAAETAAPPDGGVTGAPDPGAGMLRPEDAMVLLTGTQGNLGDCGIAVSEVVADVADARARTFIAWAGSGARLSRHPLREGDVLVCQALFRVVRAGDVSGYLPGAARPGVVIDKRPRSIPGLSIQASSIVLNVGGRTDDGSATFSDIVVAGGRGQFSAVEGAGMRGRHDVAVGDVISAGGGRRKVLALVPPDAGQGVAGWIELGATAD